MDGWSQTHPPDFLDQLQIDKEAPTHFLISCSKHKKKTEAPASELYNSPLFKLSANLPERLGIGFSILSAKHGLVNSNAKIQPYDLNLASLTLSEHVVWSESVLKQIKSNLSGIRRFVVLAGEPYRNRLVPAILASGIKVLEPLSGLSLGWRMSFLKSCHRVLDRQKSVKSVYRHFETLALDAGVHQLRDALKQSIPQQGVYFFFDPGEPSRFSNSLPRLVRIGTHGVSQGSKATLRDRLRTHFGTSDGYGNHRSSVFRLHVGEAMIRKFDLEDRFPHWGKGQNASKTLNDAEKELERDVSEYISKLQVLYVDVLDKATKDSARSIIEKQSIALFTEGFVPVERPSRSWLGLHSSHQVIAASGLWNVRDVGAKANLKIVNDIGERIICRKNIARQLTGPA